MPQKVVSISSQNKEQESQTVRRLTHAQNMSMIDRTEAKHKQCTLVSLCVSKMDKLCIAINHKINIFYITFLLFLFIKLTYTSFPSGNYYIFNSLEF